MFTPMSIISSPWIVLALVGVIVVFILFSLFKGFIKLAFFVFAVFFHGMSWFSQLFSWHRGGASTGGILTTILMCFLLFWVAMVGVSYYSDVSLIGHYHARASSGATPQQIPWISRLSARLHESPITSWMKPASPSSTRPASNIPACRSLHGSSIFSATKVCAPWWRRVALSPSWKMSISRPSCSDSIPRRS